MFTRRLLGGVVTGVAGWSLCSAYSQAGPSPSGKGTPSEDRATGRSGTPMTSQVFASALMLPRVFAKEKIAAGETPGGASGDDGIKEYWTGFTFPFRLSGKKGLVAKDHTKEEDREALGEVAHGTGKEEIVGGPAMRCMLGACHVRPRSNI
jgi:hypothetical protein